VLALWARQPQRFNVGMTSLIGPVSERRLVNIGVSSEKECRPLLSYL
jgi:hypothetical protein